MAEYIRYANQGATRNQPLSPQLTQALGFLPDLGVQMEVFSGGQDAEGPNRVGSTRHDHGNAADVFFYKDGRRLDWSNPEDVPLFQEVVRRGRAAGLTGFGAGDNYMQPGSMHLGFGGEAVWGAGGSSSNAPEWLRQAYGEGHTLDDGHGHGGAAQIGRDTMAAIGRPANTAPQQAPSSQFAGYPGQPGMNALQPPPQNALAQMPRPQYRNALNVADFQTSGLGRSLLLGIPQRG